jgi:gliding motility associated protien GldN
MKKLVLILSAFMLINSNMKAQEVKDKSRSSNEVRTSDKMYKKELVRAIDLREPQNKTLFSKNREITKLLINAVMNGQITAYTNDSLTHHLPLKTFTERMTMPNSNEIPTDPEELKIMFPDTWEEILKNPPKPELYFAKDLYQMEIKEDLFFDKQRSKMYYDIKAITIFIPADHPQNIKGIQEPVASFEFKELEKFFKDNPNAVSFNVQNDAQHKNLSDAFKLRLFSSYIIKVSNADDQYLSDLYNDQVKGIMASQWAAHELLEYEHNLWEF